MAEILIPINDAWVQYTAAGGETAFAYDFPIFDETHLVVVETDLAGAHTTLVLATDFTVSGVGALAGGNATLDPTLYPSGATAGFKYTLYRDAPEARSTDFTKQGDFLAATINRELDLVTMQLQQLRRDMDRAAVLPVTVANTVSAALPEPVASKVLAWKADLTGLENVTNGGAAVSSVFGRTGAIVAVGGDYDADEITETASNKVMTAAERTKLSGIEASATADQTAGEILTALLTVDGAGSGLDADTLDGLSSLSFSLSSHNHSGVYEPADATLTAFASLAGAADRLPYFTGSDTFALATFTAAGRALMDDANAAAQLVTLGALPLAGGTMSGALVLADQLLTRPNIKDYAVESTSPAISSGTLTLGMVNGNDFDVTLTENVTTLNVNNWSPSGTFSKITIRIVQDATGSRTFALPAGWNWPGGTPPTLPTLANEDIELVVWTRDAGTTIYAAEVGQKFA